MNAIAVEARPRLIEYDRRYRAELEKYETDGPIAPADVHAKTALLNLVLEIEEALKAIDNGTYGTCAACDRPIEEQRLKFFPWATHHTRCKSQQPQLEVKDVIAGKTHYSTAEERAKDPERARPCASCGASIPGHVVRENPDITHCLTCARAAAEEEQQFVDEPGVALTADEMTELECGHSVIGVDEGEKTAFCQDCGLNVAVVPSKTGKFVDRVIPNIHQGGKMKVPVDQIHPSPVNPRTELTDIEGLAASIDSIGLVQSIVVRPNEEGYELVAGARRLAAVKHLGWAEVEVDVQDRSDSDAEKARLVENLHRIGLAPLEEARGYERLISEHGMSQHEIAQQLGKAQSHVSKRISLLQLPDSALKKIESKDLTPSDGLELLRLKDEPKRLEKVLKDHDQASKSGFDRSVTSLVESQIQDKTADEKRKAAEKKLRDAKVPILTSAQLHAINMEQRARIGKRTYDIDVERKAHEKEPCHAAVFEHGATRAVHWCTDITRHLPTGASDLKGAIVERLIPTGPEPAGSPEADARRERLAAMGTAQDRRREFVSDLLKRTIPRDDAIELFCLVALESQWPEIATTSAAKLLGFEDEMTDLKNFTHRTAENRVRVLMAIAIDLLEAELDPEAILDTKPEELTPFQTYFEVLERHGYEPNDVEMAMVGAVAGAEEKEAANA
jgi:ParB family chromosome partitioning protein